MIKLIKSLSIGAAVLLVVSSLSLTGFAHAAPQTVPDTRGYTAHNWTYHNSEYCLGYDCLDYRNCNWENHGEGHSDWDSSFHDQWHTDHGKNDHCGWAYASATPPPYYRNSRRVSNRRGRGGCCH